MDRLFDPSLRDRRFWCLAWQIPLLVLTLALDVALAVADPDLLGTASIVTGSVAVGLLTLAAYRVPPRLLIWIPLLDIAAVALIRSEAAARIAGNNTSALVPIACLGFCFGVRGVVGATLGGALVAASPYLRWWELPGTGPAWVGVLALPALSLALGLIGLACATLVARQRTENAALLQQVRRELEIRQGVIESVDVAVAFFRSDGALLFANERAIEGATRAGVDVRGPDYRATRVWRADGMRPLAYEEQPLRLALRGEEFPPELLWTGSPDDRAASLMSARQVVSGDGEPLGVVVVADDVTELVEALRVRDEFLATLSHELRTPLNGMVGFLDLLAEDLGEDPVHGSTVRTVRDSALRLSERIGHLLLASAAGRLVLDPAPVQVAGIVEAELDRQSSEAENRGITLAGRIDQVLATLDPRLFGLVVENLLSNALKHTPPGGTVRVELRAVDGVELVVRDTGVGMQGYERDRAFDPFYRAASARRDAVAGVGLGLTIVRAVVDAHGGEVVIGTEPEGGTRVVVRLPG